MSDAPQVPFLVRPKKRRQHGASGLGSKYRKASGVYAAPASFVSPASGKTRVSVLKAAQIFAEQAKKNASVFSRRIPAATGVEAREEQLAMVVTDGVAAPNAAPFEFGERHPLNWPNQVKFLNKYGRQRNWVKQPTRAYMNRAATNQSVVDQAADVYAEAERDLLAEEHNWNE